MLPGMFARIFILCCSFFVVGAAVASSHALTLFGAPKYAANFSHFSYVNPDAPKGGRLTLAVQSNGYDSLNPFIVKGNKAAGVGYLFESLMTSSADEPFSMYGLVAKQVELAEDGMSVRFVIHENARWQDGTPITAEDAVWSFEQLVKHGHPGYRFQLQDVEEVVALAPNIVEYRFKHNTNRELPQIVAGLSILPKHYYTQQGDDAPDFTKTTLTPPLGSGPYVIDDMEPGKWIRYARNPDYWGADLPVNRGRYNFDEIHYDYYRDGNVAVEAFKAGNYDYREENVSKLWATAYEGLDALKSGKLIKRLVKNDLPRGMQAYAFNLRRPHLQDIALRKAMNHAFDFEWTNKNLFYDAYKRNQSFFTNTQFASPPLPSAEELALLEPLKAHFPSAVLHEPYTQAITDGTGNNRTQLIAAQEMLKAAGYRVVKNQLISPHNNQPVEVEFLLRSPFMERVTLPFIRSLKKLGIKGSIRTVDSAQYVKRVQSYDYDIIVEWFSPVNAPGNEQISMWHSSIVDEEGGGNSTGIANKAVDALIDIIVNAKDLDTLTTASHALDRVLLHHHLAIPQWHIDSYRQLFWNKFGQPSIRPKYSAGLDSWWMKGE